MRVFVAAGGIIVGSLLLVAGIKFVIPWLTLLGFVVLPAAVILGLQAAGQAGEPIKPEPALDAGTRDGDELAGQGGPTSAGPGRESHDQIPAEPNETAGSRDNGPRHQATRRPTDRAEDTRRAGPGG